MAGLSAITRCPRTVAQNGVHGSVNFDSNDKFCLDRQQLFAVSGSYGSDGTEYRTEVNSYTKIVSYGSQGGGPSYFRAWTKSGQIFEFGHSPDSYNPLPDPWDNATVDEAKLYADAGYVPPKNNKLSLRERRVKEV